MKIVYLGSKGIKPIPLPEVKGDAIELLSNNWNDFGFVTTFNVSCRIKDKPIVLSTIQILIEGQSNTPKYLNELLKKGWNGQFPIPNENYISTPAEITFYQQIEGVLDNVELQQAAIKLRDASYFINIVKDQEAEKLIHSPGFEDSLQRERGAVTAFLDGWKIFENEEIFVENLEFDFYDQYENQKRIELNFKPNQVFPHNIHALIGPNGVGKSMLLRKIIEKWLVPKDKGEFGFTKTPNLSQLVMVSYSPFESFPVDLKEYEKNISDNKIYKYFGLRGRSKSNTKDKPGIIRLSPAFPKRQSALSLISCLQDDKRYGSIKNWSNKIQSVESIIKAAFDFDFAAVEVSREIDDTEFYDALSIEIIPSILLGKRKIKKYIPISSKNMTDLDPIKLELHLKHNSGVTFFKNGVPLSLSSGQILYSLIVINILGAIRKNSLILVDEPELFLHPSLEIKFIELLKNILDKFASKALIATHSVVSVREIPTDCVHVFSISNNELIIKAPPFQTFGGDIQRIASYVFGDNAISKPFEGWLKQKIDEYDSKEALLDAIGNKVNEELRIQIAGMGD